MWLGRAEESEQALHGAVDQPDPLRRQRAGAAIFAVE